MSQEGSIIPQADVISHAASLSHDENQSLSQVIHEDHSSGQLHQEDQIMNLPAGDGQGLNSPTDQELLPTEQLGDPQSGRPTTENQASFGQEEEGPPNSESLDSHPSMAHSRSPKRPFEIPPDASVIDVDMIDTVPGSVSLFGEGRYISPVIKSEPRDSASHDSLALEAPNSRPSSVQTGDQSAVDPGIFIKQEPAEFSRLPRLRGMGQSDAAPIEISDGEEEVVGANLIPHPQEPASGPGPSEQQPHQNRTNESQESAAVASLNLGCSSLTKKADGQASGQSKNTPQLSEKEKMRAAQKAMAQKILARDVNLSTKHIVSSSTSTAGPSSLGSRPPRPGKKDDKDWSIVDESDEDDPQASFEAYALEFKKRKAAGKTDLQEEVAFMKRQSAYEDRKNRRELAKARIAHQKQREESQTSEGLFVGEDQEQASSATAPSLKRMRDQLGDSDLDNDSDMDNNDNSTPNQSARKRKRAPRKGPSKKDEQMSMSAGIDDNLAKEEKKKRRKTNKDQASQSGASSRGAKGKGGRPKGSKSNSSARPRQSKKDGRDIPGGQKQRLQLMKDFASFSNSNIYVDANENLTRGGLPDLTQRNKAEALKALIASVPEQDRRGANLDKKQILDASKTLGPKGLCRMDGRGGWHLKGFNGSLKHHQVLGAAFMHEREMQSVGEPYGGLCADEMGFGKTIMMIANMIANKAPEGTPIKTTLIVATPGLITQWSNEITKFASREALPIVICCVHQNALYGPGTAKLLQHADVILTTYQMILKSYPKYEPPPEIVNPEEKRKWWETYYNANRGFFHQTKFHRIVIDEAQYIKNYQARTSIACRGLMGKYRWAMSGTPIHNSIEELYPYFKFLHVKHTGSLGTFKENFCSKGSEISNSRLHGFLRMFMMRRTHKDTLFNAPIIKLPKNHQTTIEIEFNAVERKIYDIVKHRFMTRIEHWYRSGGDENLQKNYNNILVMLMRLRQLTTHIFLAQKTIEELFELEDIEELWAITEKETKPDNPDKALLNRMSQLISAARARARQTSAEQTGDRKAKSKGKQKEPVRIETGMSIDEVDEETGGPSTGPMDADAVERTAEEVRKMPKQLTFKFRKFIRAMRESKNWDEIADRSVCRRCEERPDNPHVTDCFHIYCQDCLQAILSEAAEVNEDSASCLACGAQFKEAIPCPGLNALGHSGNGNEHSKPSAKNRRRQSRSCSSDQENAEDGNIEWICKEGAILPSSKLTMVALTVDAWLKEDPTKKIIIFTQWRLMYIDLPPEVRCARANISQDQDPREAVSTASLGP